jgi:hypothetical protein
LLREVFEKGIEGFFGFARRRLQWPDREVKGVGRLRRCTSERQCKSEGEYPSDGAVASASIQVHDEGPR